MNDRTLSSPLREPLQDTPSWMTLHGRAVPSFEQGWLWKEDVSHSGTRVLHLKQIKMGARSAFLRLGDILHLDTGDTAAVIYLRKHCFPKQGARYCLGVVAVSLEAEWQPTGTEITEVKLSKISRLWSWNGAWLQQSKFLASLTAGLTDEYFQERDVMLGIQSNGHSAALMGNHVPLQLFLQEKRRADEAELRLKLILQIAQQ
eukprot:TRINITY_DN6021_c0_g1_i1.p1 TRINITY_DN6021_c0_g1~~TRINITY_DN6021_c0_g1_i1.p1  ORF type:complete len:203 (+),score=27.73 TRINITY_DN6021_c0_g1_i1:104-712(+)